jgi:hypothetical protein
MRKKRKYKAILSQSIVLYSFFRFNSPFKDYLSKRISNKTCKVQAKLKLNGKEISEISDSSGDDLSSESSIDTEEELDLE